MFILTTFIPASHALVALPSTYCDKLEPSSPWTIITVALRSASACQWQWHSTCVSASTRYKHASGSGRSLFRRRKLPAMVMAWRLRRYLRGTNGSNISSFEFSAMMQQQHSFLPLIRTDDTDQDRENLLRFFPCPISSVFLCVLCG